MLSGDDLALLRPHLEHHAMRPGDVLAEPHDQIRRIYFPLGGIISCVVPLSDGGTIEKGMIGREGEMGAALAQDDKMAVNRILVQVPGQALVIDPDRFREAT